MKNYFNDVQTLDEAKALFKTLAKSLHPDVNPDNPTATADFQSMLNQFQSFKPSKEKFKGEAEQWNGKQYAEIILQLLKIEGINITICGSWIWLDGETKPVKDQIKEIECGEFMKRGFSGNKSQWYFSPKGYRKRSSKAHSFDDIKGYFGAETVNKNQPNRINA